METLRDMIRREWTGPRRFASLGEGPSVSESRFDSGGESCKKLFTFVSGGRGLFRTTVFNQKSCCCSVATALGSLTGNLETSQFGETIVLGTSLIFDTPVVCVEVSRDERGPITLFC